MEEVNEQVEESEAILRLMITTCCLHACCWRDREEVWLLTPCKQRHLVRAVLAKPTWKPNGKEARKQFYTHRCPKQTKGSVGN